MPPPHLHPRSRMTSSLFATTVLASFLVVALPHILPCPAPRRAYADGGDGAIPGQTGADGGSDGVRVRRGRRRREGIASADGEVGAGVGGAAASEGMGVVEFRPGMGKVGEEEGVVKRRREGQKRECPVPKPGGILGEWLGFHGVAGEGEVKKGRPDR
ncbi:hypothetical protein B0J18DRAFT_472452 [Chaetomium sp. MPI-SDFR-AT-0129]|uniref:Uncharacterized protein n=1 Tax=Dichotomopilus funicola TaxID=1934379 RepID=A0AAN6VB15_9PEZI|nr:hypothetical protein B0J18DRAFT_472452 [Chaetomium sp. MPI-SDFR-AT-0129]KAK4146836.1 hypothetical protein C8A04DRAFT_25413 [Dichotomopilus funicola]